MINTDGTGNVASRSGVFFMSQTSSLWRADNDVQGADGAGGANEMSVFDCYFGDAETQVDTNNGRNDNGLGFGLLNCKGCNFPDVNTFCRMTFRD